MTTTVVNPLFFGHNLVFSGNGLWHTKLNDVDPGAVPFVKNLSPTIVRSPGGNISDLYIWEDGIGYRTTTSVTSTDSSIILEAAPFWGTGQKARFIDSDGGQFGDPFSFTRLAGKQIEGVAGLHATHAAGAQMRLEAR